MLLSRELSPLGSGRSEAAVLRAASVGVYDFDDALYTAIPGSLISRIHTRRTLWRRSVEAADVVFAGSEILAEHAQRHSSRVQLMPSVVEPAQYTRKQDYALGKTPSPCGSGRRVRSRTCATAPRGFSLRIARPGSGFA